MFAALLQSRGKGQQILGKARGRDGCHQLGFAFRQGAGLVKSHDVDGVGDFQCLRVFDQNAVACGHTGAGHDGGGCSQAQRTGAGYHQHGHRVQNGLLPVAVVEAPTQKGEQRQHQHHWHKNGTHLVHHALDRRFFCLGGFDHTHNARQGGFGPDGAGLHQQQAFCIDRATRDPVTHQFADRQAFARDQGFVHLAGAFNNDAINRNACTRANDHHIAHSYARDR